jgi:hypothetical protein
MQREDYEGQTNASATNILDSTPEALPPLAGGNAAGFGANNSL